MNDKENKAKQAERALEEAKKRRSDKRANYEKMPVITELLEIRAFCKRKGITKQ